MEGIICLCGSTRFRQTYLDFNSDLSLRGWIVLTVGLFGHYEPEKLTAGVKEKLDELHKRKIDLADIVFILDVDGYIGDSTKSEIAYAKEHNKRVLYLSEVYPEYKEPEDQIMALEHKLEAAMTYIPRVCETCKWDKVPCIRGKSPCYDCIGHSHPCWAWNEG